MLMHIGRLAKVADSEFSLLVRLAIHDLHFLPHLSWKKSGLIIAARL